VVGLYLNPPEKALVLSVDEKSQIQALDRTQPGLPMKRGRAGTWTHDYKRHGVTTLFAALDVATGKVIGQCMKQHRHQEWLKFLRAIDRATPKGLDLHLIADNYATHKHPTVKAWLAKHSRFHMHFTPTSASWLNQVERFFGRITDKHIRRGVFKSVGELESAIMDYLNQHNAQPRPLRVDQVRWRNPRKSRPRETNVRVTALEGNLAKPFVARGQQVPGSSPCDRNPSFLKGRPSLGADAMRAVAASFKACRVRDRLGLCRPKRHACCWWQEYAKSGYGKYLAPISPDSKPDPPCLHLVLADIGQKIGVDYNAARRLSLAVWVVGRTFSWCMGQNRRLARHCEKVSTLI
jgi:transposase